MLVLSAFNASARIDGVTFQVSGPARTPYFGPQMFGDGHLKFLGVIRNRGHKPCSAPLHFERCIKVSSVVRDGKRVLPTKDESSPIESNVGECFEQLDLQPGEETQFRFTGPKSYSETLSATPGKYTVRFQIEAGDLKAARRCGELLQSNAVDFEIVSSSDGGNSDE